MGKWARRIRGALGMGVVWGTAWMGAGLVMMLTFLLTTGSTGADVPYPLGFGLLGFLAGVVFSVVLGLVERHRRFDQMSLPRFGAWGAAGGALLSGGFVVAVSLVDGPAFLWNLLFLAPILSAAGAVCAAGSLVLARRANGPRLGDAADDTDRLMLQDDEHDRVIGRGR
jgi:hypothetical protein